MKVVSGTSRRIGLRFNDALYNNGQEKYYGLKNSRIYPATNVTFDINIREEEPIRKIFVTYARTKEFVEDNWGLSRIWIKDYLNNETVFFESFKSFFGFTTPTFVRSCKN